MLLENLELKDELVEYLQKIGKYVWAIDIVNFTACNII